jgi:hypothetical protein
MKPELNRHKKVALWIVGQICALRELGMIARWRYSLDDSDLEYAKKLEEDGFAPTVAEIQLHMMIMREELSPIPAVSAAISPSSSNQEYITPCSTATPEQEHFDISWFYRQGFWSRLFLRLFCNRVNRIVHRVVESVLERNQISHNQNREILAVVNRMLTL